MSAVRIPAGGPPSPCRAGYWRPIHFITLAVTEPFGRSPELFGPGPSPLGLDAPPAGGSRRTDGLAGRRRRLQRIVEQGPESAPGDLAIPPLGSVVVHHHPDSSRTYPGLQAPTDPVLLMIVEGGRPQDGECKPRPGSGPVGVLTSRSRGGSEVPAKFPGGNDRSPVERQVAFRYLRHAGPN